MEADERRRRCARRVVVYLVSLFAVPSTLVGALFVVAGDSRLGMLVGSTVAPFLWAGTYLSVACSLARLHAPEIRKGVGARDPGIPWYYHRRLYGVLWAAVYYFTPLYYCCLSLPRLRRWVFRAFGYRGSPDVTLYPDTWIRDLPLLDLGAGVYVSNRATLGTNIPTRSDLATGRRTEADDGTTSKGKIYVGDICIGEGSLVGHLAIVGPFTRIGRYCEVQAGCIVSPRVVLGDQVVVRGYAGIDISARVGARTTIGARSYVGKYTRIGSDMKIPDGAVLPSGTSFPDQRALDSYLDSVRYGSEHWAPWSRTKGAART